MRMKDLAWLVRLADTGHVTETAAVLGVPQSTLSRSALRVESELGTSLFTRHSDGVRTTAAGELVVQAARDVDSRYLRMLDELETLLDPDAGTVRLAFLDSMGTSLVPGILRAFHSHAPATRIILRQEPAHEILRDLDLGAVDLAITSFEVGEDYGWHPLQDERMVVVLPATHRYAHRRRLRLEDLDGQEQVTTPAGFGHRTLVDGLLGAAGVTLPISFESQDLATIEGLVAAGLGIGILPEHFAGQSGTVGVDIRAEGARRSVGLAWRGDRPLPPPAERFKDFVTRSTVTKPD